MDAAEGVRGLGAANPPHACPRLRTRGGLRPEAASRWTVPGKTPKGAEAGPYRKPTQVDEANSLRCSRQLGRRNSANQPRNFGIRGASEGQYEQYEAFGGRRETAEATVYQKHRAMLTRKWTYMV